MSATTTTRPRGYISDYRPQRRTRALLEQVDAVLDDYRDSLPLTLRQAFYRLVGKHGFPKTERAYERLSHHIANARRAGWLPWEAIRDDGILGGPPVLHFRDASDFWRRMRRYAERAELDALVSQEVNVELLSEAGGMVPQLQRVATPFSVPVYSSGGFDSLTAKKDLADRLLDDGRPAVVLHVGDLDPSGESMFDALAEDVEEFLAVDAAWLAVEFRRVALTAEQVGEYDLPTAPPKRSDSRSKRWTGETCQLEAMPPDLLATLVREALEDVVDVSQVEEARGASLGFRRGLLDTLAGLVDL